MISLSEAQSKIVKAPIGVAMQVLAAPGSGKTRVLTERVRFILENTKKDSVIALTFTNRAAEEMQSRLADVEDSDERSWVSTVHSIAQRILEKYGHTTGLPSELHIYDRDKDRMEVFLQSLRNDGVDIDDYLDITDTKEKRSRERRMQGYMEAFSAIKRELLTSEEEVQDMFPSEDRLWNIFNDYQQALLESGGIDFDDILIRAHEILQTHDWVGEVYRAKYKHLCIDEAQDLNRAQYEFIKVLCGEGIKSILMVGDPDQMIYGFNGSSSDYLCKEYIADFKPQEFKLIENYRSTKAVINVSNKLKPNSQKMNDAALKGTVEIKSMPDETAEAKWVVEQIKYLLDLKTHDEIEGEISLDKMVVIARNRFVFLKLEEELNEKGIPFFLKKGERRTEASSLFGKVLDYGIRVKLNSKDWVDGKKLCKLLKLSLPSSWGNEGLLLEWSNNINLKNNMLSGLQSELLKSLEALDSDNPNIRKFCIEYDKKLKNLASGSSNEKDKAELERSIVELGEFQNSWTRFKQKGLGDSLQAFRNALSLGQFMEDANTGGLTLSTVHTMKGLEKDVVFLIGMCEGVFPDYRAVKPKEINEERNSAFVAVTRAKRWLYVTYPQSRMMPWGGYKRQQHSRFLTEMS